VLDENEPQMSLDPPQYCQAGQLAKTFRVSQASVANPTESHIFTDVFFPAYASSAAGKPSLLQH
jgi:hypothetical protein